MGVVNPVFVPLGVKVREGPNRFEGTAGDRSVLHVLYVGSLIPRKSISTLLEALHLLRRRGVETAAAIVGDGPDRRTLEELAKHHRLEVRFIGEVPHREVGAWMERADVLVLPSTAEGRPVVVLEAMAASLPVVVSDIDGSRELIDDGRTGYLFPPGDADKLADFLEILSDVEVRKHLAASALQFVNDSGLSDVAAAKRFLELYLLLDTKYVAKINV
jgi:glycosyltransferase involved in cell wall biosynthesis